ncbi:MAG: glucose-6-phosphate dehydrogenase [Microbacteriaceae bacterium]|jgi:glucose-6-phosphate 1-dehydrogenase|nr:glucose-6-phosphate dehydrogenase [Microbacteriaceae bacterium]HEV7957426.1 glucose-6-phosphate dehydrogenase [Marisediminicola sp.]
MTPAQRTLVIFGASGDLTARLLLPGVGQLLESPRGGDIQLLGVGDRPMSDDEWRQRVSDSFAAGGATGEWVPALLSATRYLQADVTKADDLRRVFAACDGLPALYFALPPAVTIAVCTALRSVQIPEGTVLALEKPFGTDLVTARELNRQLATLLPENQIHRVDHFLGKSTVLNLLGLRFANRIFEPLWNGQNIERVEIVFEEKLGLEGRAGYYDKAGALVDMIQSHLLLVLALVTIEPPSSIEPDDLRGAIAQALRATRVRGDDPSEASRRARYTRGSIDDREFVDYVEEPGVDPARGTETLAEVTLSVDNWRWAGVPFVLRSGKALSGVRKDIVITFKDVPHLPYGFEGGSGAERLRISLSPDELELEININGEGDPFVLDRVVLSTTFGAGELGPYGEVLAGILAGDPTLSVRGDAVEECWRIVEPVLTAWRAGEVPLDEYPAGSNGPAGWGTVRDVGAGEEGR